MNSAFVIRLGSGGCAKHGVGGKGRWLDAAARAGLPVPRGVVVLDTAADLAVLHGAAEQVPAGLAVVDAQKLMTLLQLPQFEREVAVRSAFGSEDGESTSMAGAFTTVLHVNSRDQDAIGQAIGAVWSSAQLPSITDTAEFAGDRPGIRRDLLVMEMVEAVKSGIAVTEQEFEDDIVNFAEGTAWRLTSGEISGETLSLPKLRGWEKFALPANLPPWAARLQTLMRDIRRWLGARDWDVEWADDGKTCWLIQLRPLTRETIRDEEFSIANHKEILPPLPSVFMASLVESCAFDLYTYYRDFDPALPKKRPFLEIFHGRPYINLSLMAETMRHWGLPTRLITDNIGGRAGTPYALNVRRFLTKTWRMTLVRQFFAQLFSVRGARKATERLEARIATLKQQSLTEHVEAARWLYGTLVRQMFSLLAASGPTVALLARIGVLAELSTRIETVSTRKFREQETIRAYVAQRPEMAHVLANGQVPDDEGFAALWTRYLEAFGHRGTFESDLSRPRDAEEPNDILRSFANPPKLPPTVRSPRPVAWVMWPLWLYASRAILAREQWRHDVMRGFSAVRAGLLRTAEPYVMAGALPSLDHLWRLRIDEVRQLEEGWTPDDEFWTEREAEISSLKLIDPPDMLRRFDSLPVTRTGHENGILSGIPLSRGEVEGQAWVLHEPVSNLPEGFRRDSTILVARSIDVGWVRTFGIVAGAVVETGGHLSHGSIVLREIGLPSVTNVAGATHTIKTGDRVILNANRGIVIRDSH